ncbi:MAG: hypothetical protein DSM106950_41760 [Stigonema ocellatum SAG 48.90 = DSM 106950]|nr:hypothetical protein [Stigonema ocellatum SAG 48.90 = DSM 106950]
MCSYKMLLVAISDDKPLVRGFQETREGGGGEWERGAIAISNKGDRLWLFFVLTSSSNSLLIIHGMEVRNFELPIS